MAQTHKQQGSAHAVVVIVLVLALITALGWIFWQNFIHKEPAKTDTEIVTIKQSNSQQEKTDQASTEKKKSLDIEIKEWGVGANYDTSLGAMSYRIKDGEGGAQFVGTDLLNTTSCSYLSAGSIARYKPEDIVYMGVGSKGVVAKDAPASYRVKKVGEFYYQTVGPQALCSEEKEQEQLDATKARQDIFDHLEVID